MPDTSYSKLGWELPLLWNPIPHDHRRTEMNETITIDGKDYEVLPLDRIGEITHAKLAGGKVWTAKGVKPETIEAYATIKRPGADGGRVLNASEFTDLGIQPLKLIERVPVEFVATFALVGGFWTPVTCLDDGIAYKNCEQRKFRCVEVVE
jgi:hypothetical protein